VEHEQKDPRPHSVITNVFSKKGWRREEVASSVSGMRYDLMKDKVAIEVETSHIIHSYKDYLKFLVGFNEGKIDVGVEVVYTKAFIERSRASKAKPTLEKIKRSYFVQANYSSSDTSDRAGVTQGEFGRSSKTQYRHSNGSMRKK